MGAEALGAVKAVMMISRIQVGNDVSKRWFDVFYLVGKEEFLARYPNTPEGHASFISAVKGLAKTVHVCMEHTGGFEAAMAMAFKEAGFIVSLVDGAKIAHYRKSFGSAKHKTDPNCARLLWRFCKERRPPEWFPLPDQYRKLRELVRHRERLIESKIEWSSRSQYIVESPTVAAQRQTLCECFKLQIENIEEEIAAHIKAHQDLAKNLELLLSIPGVAFKSAVRIMAETGPIANYPSAKAYGLAAGLVPIMIHSGQSVPPGKLPIYGNRELRCALYFPVLVSKRLKKGVWTFMERVGQKGDKQKMTVVAAGMRKLAHVVFGVLTSQMPFDPQRVLGKTAASQT